MDAKLGKEISAFAKEAKRLRKILNDTKKIFGDINVTGTVLVRPINLSLSQFLKDGCIGERQMALVCKKHKRPEGQQVAHILTLNLY